MAQAGAQSGEAGRVGGPRAGLETLVAALLWLVPLAALCLRCAVVDSVPFLPPGSAAPWIMAPLPVSAQLHQWGEVEAPATRFTRDFELAAPARVDVRLRALGALRVWLNGAEIDVARAGPERGRAELRLALEPRPGPNQLVVEVRNRRGPGLLSLAGAGHPQLDTGPDWRVSVDGGHPTPASVADDTRTDPRALAVETPAEALAAERNPLALLFVLGAAGFLAGRRLLGERALAALPVAALVAAHVAWLQWIVTRALRIPPAVGFDARHHLHYVSWILEERSLPLATDGWSTYHPPLFHLLSAGVAGLSGEGAALKWLPALAGLGTLWLSYALARRLLPEAPLAHALAVLFAAVLPVNLYSAAYFSNESLHALLAGGALLATTALLLGDGAPARRWVPAALLFGLAALAKFTVLVTLPVALFFLGWKRLLLDAAGWRRSAATLAGFAAVFLAVAGAFYARNLLHFGAPVVGNWALPGEARDWWLLPGFHTAAWYAGFGESLVHPYLAGFHSLWDGLYSTFWGDGYLGGRADPSQRHTFWSYGFMSAGYWLALPATVLLAAGCLRLAGAAALGPGAARWRLAVGFLATCGWAVGLAFVSLTLEIPVFAQAKAAYLLMLAAPLAVAFANAFSHLDAWLAAAGATALRAVLYGWLATFAGALFLGFAA